MARCLSFPQGNLLSWEQMRDRWTRSNVTEVSADRKGYCRDLEDEKLEFSCHAIKKSVSRDTFFYLKVFDCVS